jgi:hypothetical protein
MCKRIRITTITVKVLMMTALGLAGAGCGNGGSGMSKDTPVAKHDVVSLLHKKYQNSKIKYYNDLNYLGIGIANPKRFDFRFG